VRVSMAENKPLLISRLLELKTVGLQVGVDLIVGVNSVTRLLERTRMNSLLYYFRHWHNANSIDLLVGSAFAKSDL